MLIVKLLNLTYNKILQEMVSLKLIETVNYKSPAGEWEGYNEDCKLQNYTDPYHTPNARKSVLELTNGSY